MLVPKILLESVAFIGWRNGAEFVPVGTGFFVCLPLDDEGGVFCCVTARHVIDDVEERSKDSDVYVRCTGKDGKQLFFSRPVNLWVKHEDPLVDVAWFSLPQDPVQFDIGFIDESVFATRTLLESESIGVGSEVFFPGMFSGYLGEESNVPILRRGSIAAFPDGRVKTKWGNLRVILIEARSIGGMSGSPVFATAGLVKINNDGVAHIVQGTPQAFLIGLMHGHYSKRGSVGDTATDFWSPLEQQGVNMGIGLVVPAELILGGIKSWIANIEVMTSGDLEKQLREQAEASAARQVNDGTSNAAGD